MPRHNSNDIARRKSELERELIRAEREYESNPTQANELRYEKLLNAYLRIIEN